MGNNLACKACDWLERSVVSRENQSKNDSVCETPLHKNTSETYGLNLSEGDILLNRTITL